MCVHILALPRKRQNLYLQVVLPAPTALHHHHQVCLCEGERNISCISSLVGEKRREGRRMREREGKRENEEGKDKRKKEGDTEKRRAQEKREGVCLSPHLLRKVSTRHAFSHLPGRVLWWTAS